MNIIEAIKAAKNGNRVYRDIVIKDKLIVRSWIPFVDLEQEKFTVSDILADDWLISEEKMTDNNKPWEKENNRYHFFDNVSGYDIFIYRHSRMKHLCGYVKLPESHPLFGINHMDSDVYDKIDVHGGVTFSDTLNTRHNLDVHYDTDFLVGFDCAHAGDFVPELSEELVRGNEVYRDIDYVVAECIKLARQLKEMEDLK